MSSWCQVGSSPPELIVGRTIEAKSINNRRQECIPSTACHQRYTGQPFGTVTIEVNYNEMVSVRCSDLVYIFARN